MDDEEIKEVDELDEIFVNKNIPINKKLLVEILKSFVTIDEEGMIDFKEDYEKLSYWKKILIYLLCKKALTSRKIIDKEYANPKEISENAMIGESAAKKISNNETIKRLTKKTKEGYFIQNYNLKKIKDIILGKEENEN
ncbi:hypothetical protein KAT24_00370 [Candidatus Pacearchaeota archaeon]|nr:hypothetical protein [Candidatus Pacearchaeota archaeon]